MSRFSNITSEIVTEENQDVFVKFLKQERDASRQRDRNADWFDYLLDKDFWQIYPMWTMSRIDDQVWTIAAVQKHNFTTGVYRVMSRRYVKEYLRKPTEQMPTDMYNWPAKSAYLFPPMLDMMNSVEGSTMIMTMEHVKRVRNLKVISHYFNKNYNTNFKVQPHMYQTFNDRDNWKSWQVLTSNKEVDLPHITKDEWIKRFPEAGLSLRASADPSFQGIHPFLLLHQIQQHRPTRLALWVETQQRVLRYAQRSTKPSLQYYGQGLYIDLRAARIHRL